MSDAPRTPDSVRSFASDTHSPRATHTPPAQDHSRTSSPVRSEPNTPSPAPAAAVASAAPLPATASRTMDNANADGWSRQMKDIATKLQSLAATSFAYLTDLASRNFPMAGDADAAAPFSANPFAFGDGTAAAGSGGAVIPFDPSSFSFSAFAPAAATTATSTPSFAFAKSPAAGFAAIPNKTASDSSAKVGGSGFRAPASSKARRTGAGPAASVTAAATIRQPAMDGFSGFSLPVPAGSTNNSGSSGISSSSALPVFDFGSPTPVSAEHAAKRVALYRHALESIFAFLPLSDLSRVLATSREWAAAVGSMAPIAGRCGVSVSGQPGVFAMQRSRLARHVRVLGVAGSRLASVDQAAFDAFSACYPNLRELHVHLDVAHTRSQFGIDTIVAPIRFPPRLRTLELHVSVFLVSHPLMDLHTRVMGAILQLQELQSLHLSGHSVIGPLAPLQSLPNLTDLELQFVQENRFQIVPGAGVNPYEASINELRQMGHLRRLAVHLTDMQAFEKLLAEPTDALQWQDIGPLQVPWSNQVGRLLARLPCLNTLTLGYFDFCQTADGEQLSLSGLGNLASLTSLRLQMDTQLPSAHSKRLPEMIVRAAAEGALRRLLSLSIDSTKLELSSDDFVAVLQGTPLLTSFAVVNLRTGSLRFLAHAPPALRCLSLTTSCRVFGHLEPDLLPLSELEWLKALATRRIDGHPPLEEMRLHDTIRFDAFERMHFRHLSVFDYACKR